MFGLIVPFFLLLQVGSISRSPPPRENGSFPSCSPELNGHEVEAELLVSGKDAVRQESGVISKLRKMLKKICSTHQFQNEQVRRRNLIKKAERRYHMQIALDRF